MTSPENERGADFRVRPQPADPREGAGPVRRPLLAAPPLLHPGVEEDGASLGDEAGGAGPTHQEDRSHGKGALRVAHGEMFPQLIGLNI